MPSGIIRLSANPSYCIGVDNQQSGASVVLLPISGTNPNHFIWNWNILNGYITLVSTSGGASPLVMSTTSCNSDTHITLGIQSSQDSKQQWSWLGSNTFIRSVACQGMVVDNKERHENSGNTIWLYPYNGSPAQQWNMEDMDAVEVEAALKTS